MREPEVRFSKVSDEERARIKSSEFPTLDDAAKHGKMPVVGDLFIESDVFALYPPFRHHNGLPMVVVLEQAEKTKRAKKAYVITAFGEYDEVTRKKTFLYGSYNKVKGIPTVHVDQANPDTTTSWQIPSEGKDTKNLTKIKLITL